MAWPLNSVTRLDAWEFSLRLRRYCDALDALIQETKPSDAIGSQDWALWARSYAESIDPLGEVPTVPVVPEPKAEDLKPFLDGWSPYGPDSSFR